MDIKLNELRLIESKRELEAIPEGKKLINTINAHSYNTALKDKLFAEALQRGDALIPDGASIVMACRWLKAKSQPKERIAGWDLFVMEMERLNRKGGKCFFMGSSEKVLGLIKERTKAVYPNITVETYSPPYKPEFSEEDNRAIIEAINRADPDLLWIGMTAPKQEKWTYTHWDELKIRCHTGTIGAVFDFCRHGGKGAGMVAETQPGMAVPAAERAETDVETVHHRKHAVSVECGEADDEKAINGLKKH